jgi:hypothetical protein
MFLVIKLSLYMFQPMAAIIRKATNTLKEMLHIYYMHLIMYQLPYNLKIVKVDLLKFFN